jgi:hypothetical protein
MRGGAVGDRLTEGDIKSHAYLCGSTSLPAAELNQWFVIKPAAPAAPAVAAAAAAAAAPAADDPYLTTTGVPRSISEIKLSVPESYRARFPDDGVMMAVYSLPAAAAAAAGAGAAAPAPEYKLVAPAKLTNGVWAVKAAAPPAAGAGAGAGAGAAARVAAPVPLMGGKYKVKKH